MQRFTYLSIFSLIVIFIGMSLGSRAQNYSSQNNYSGAWESNVSWVGTNSPGLNFNQDANVNVNGEISTSTNLFFNKGELIIVDTLVVNGDLGFGSNGDLSVVAGGVLIVLGSLDVGNKVDIAAGGTIIITGNVNFSGSSGQGSFTSTETPSQVYIGGYTGNPPTSGGESAVFNCGLLPVNEHENSECNYGVIEDIEGEVIEEYFQEIICGGGVDPGAIASDQTVCDGNNALTIIESSPSSESIFQWFSSVDSTDPNTGTWTMITGATLQTYDPGVVTETISFYRQVKKGNGCTAISNTVIITFSSNPNPIGIFYE